jgi:hypothetical protein
MVYKFVSMSSFAFTYLLGFEAKRQLKVIDCAANVVLKYPQPTILNQGSGIRNVGYGWTTYLTDKTDTECNPTKCKFSEEPGCCDDTCGYEYEI